MTPGESFRALCDECVKGDLGPVKLVGMPDGLDYALNCTEPASVFEEHVEGCRLWHAMKEDPQARRTMLVVWAYDRGREVQKLAVACEEPAAGGAVKFKGTIYCSECGETLAEAHGVLEHEKASHERMAIFNCRPRCEHAKAEMGAKKGMCFSIGVTWLPEEPEWLLELYEEKRLLSHTNRLSPEQIERLGEINAKIDEFQAPLKEPSARREWACIPNCTLQETKS